MYILLPYIYIHAHIYIHVHIHIYIYIYTYIWYVVITYIVLSTVGWPPSFSTIFVTRPEECQRQLHRLIAPSTPEIALARRPVEGCLRVYFFWGHRLWHRPWEYPSFGFNEFLRSQLLAGSWSSLNSCDALSEVRTPQKISLDPMPIHGGVVEWLVTVNKKTRGIPSGKLT